MTARPLVLAGLAVTGLLAVSPAPATAEIAGRSLSCEEAKAQEPLRGLKNRIRWSTASEVENFGYDVYRGGAEEGPFERLTERPVPGSGTTDEPSCYELVDDTIEAGRPYFYYVESISLHGERERFTPVIEAPAKPAPEPEPPPDRR